MIKILVKNSEKFYKKVFTNKKTYGNIILSFGKLNDIQQ